MLNESIRFLDDRLYVDNVELGALGDQFGTPLYVYSLRRIAANYRAIAAAFAPLGAEIHFSAKSNGNLAVLETLVKEGAGIDAVSAGEAYRALRAGCAPAKIVFAGVGKTFAELQWAVEHGLGWFNVENELELEYLNRIASQTGTRIRAALRLNPDVTANTHPYIATGHGAAKFGLTADVVDAVLARRSSYPHVDITGLHLHIGSQLGDTQATGKAVDTAVAIAKQHDGITTLNVGGGLPLAYDPHSQLPSPHEFMDVLAQRAAGFQLLLEPGRSISGDAGVLLTTVLYVKHQGGQRIVIADGSMTELLRPALYGAKHAIVPVAARGESISPAQIVGPVCESSDVLGRDVPLPALAPGDLLAVLDAGAYGMVMASNYNARVRPAEIVIETDGSTVRVARRRETWDDLLLCEV
ncbi:MAG: diaminopimelate decarboxylase [Chloroflexi bacterium]|jgi:diaminopimelate decarboxylase|nr:MAG: diaminopimelate decarboxylase [Chloroflexi bacterium OLB13]MBC6955404.1 diaminopimelate decarboxylase [Chloroflexota bacterium]MBV6435412.1 Diaminopimelate decarboxylase [Anaerolineae bacterium]MDL1915296.1 diaminopimelate decarboxylase [Anaerolineae bacterium CFX4]OQY86498.1 MAG: diaminopimelate decarboxylase [Anaerolineae bacterium UTCFX5]